MSGYSTDPGMSPHARRRNLRALGFLVALIGVVIAAFAAWNVLRVVLFMGDAGRATAEWDRTQFHFKDTKGRNLYASPGLLELLILPDASSGATADVMYNSDGDVLFGRPAHLLVLFGVIGVAGAVIAIAGHEMVMRGQEPRGPTRRA